MKIMSIFVVGIGIAVTAVLSYFNGYTNTEVLLMMVVSLLVMINGHLLVISDKMK